MYILIPSSSQAKPNHFLNTSDLPDYLLEELNCIVYKRFLKMGNTMYISILQLFLGKVYSFQSGDNLTENNTLESKLSTTGLPGTAGLFLKMPDSQGECVWPSILECDFSQEVQSSCQPVLSSQHVQSPE